MCCNSILKQKDLASLTACMGRLQLIKPYGKQTIWTQHNISPLSDSVPISYQIALIYFSPNVLPWKDNFAWALRGSGMAHGLCLLSYPLTSQKAQSNSSIKNLFGKVHIRKATGKLPPTPAPPPCTIIDQFNLISSQTTDTANGFISTHSIW